LTEKFTNDLIFFSLQIFEAVSFFFKSKLRFVFAIKKSYLKTFLEKGGKSSDEVFGYSEGLAY